MSALQQHDSPAQRAAYRHRLYPQEPRTLWPRSLRSLREPSARTLRYALWFIEAGWRLQEVAYLFDADPLRLAALLCVPA